MTSLHRRPKARDIYVGQLQELADFGGTVEVRGTRTVELLNVITEIEQPEHHCILIPSRRWNPWLAMSEFLWIMAGRNDIKALLPYNSHIGDYSDDGRVLHGAYGPRMFHQIDDVVARLQKDPSDRRAVVQIWSKGDLTAITKDPPCNDMLFFKIREGRLHMTVLNRSNDIHFGLYAVNIPTFGLLQEYMAARLGVELGFQTHLSNSLHYYTSDQRAVDITSRMLLSGHEGLPTYPAHQNAFYPQEGVASLGHEAAADICNTVLEGEKLPNKRGFLFFHFASIFLGCYRRRDISGLDNYPEFADWVASAKLWKEAMWK